MPDEIPNPPPPALAPDPVPAIPGAPATPPEGARVERRTAPWPETKVLATVLAGILTLLIVEILVSRWRGESARVERAPEHELDYRIDVNQATVAELVHLPGIGPALAERILAERTENGPFRNLEDLGRVRGIGPVKLADMAPYLAWPTDESAATPPAPPKTPEAKVSEKGKRTRKGLSKND